MSRAVRPACVPVGEVAESVRVQQFSAASISPLMQTWSGVNRSATRNQRRLTIAVQEATVVIERVVFPLFQVS